MPMNRVHAQENYLKLLGAPASRLSVPVRRPDRGSVGRRAGGLRHLREGRLHAQDGPARRGHRRRLGRGHRGQVRAPRGPGHRGGPARAEPPVHLLSVQQPRAERRPDDRRASRSSYDGLAPARRQDASTRAPPPSSPTGSACASATATSSTTGSSCRPGVEFQWEQVEGLAAEPGQGAPRLEGGAADRRAGRGSSRPCPTAASSCSPCPPVAYRCPPGPYERTCQVAWYLKTKKPRAKLIVLDANQNVVSKAALFREAWKAYPNLDYRASQQGGRRSTRARARCGPSSTRVKYDVLNLIPPQRAGAIAVQADLVGADKRWCEVDHVTYESVKHKGVHVIGDATTGLPVPKSGNVANAMGKICASAVVQPARGQAGAADPARQHLLQLGERPRGHRGRQRLQDRERQGRPDRAEAHAGAERGAWPSAPSAGPRASGPTCWPDATARSAPRRAARRRETRAMTADDDIAGWPLRTSSLARRPGACRARRGAGPLDDPGSPRRSRARRATAPPATAGPTRCRSSRAWTPGVLQEADRGLRRRASGRRRRWSPTPRGASSSAWTTSPRYFARAEEQPTPIAVRRRRPWRAGGRPRRRARPATGRTGKGDAAKGIPSLAGQPPGFLAEQMLLFKQDRRNPGDPALEAVKALMKTIPTRRSPTSPPTTRASGSVPTGWAAGCGRAQPGCPRLMTSNRAEAFRPRRCGRRVRAGEARVPAPW